MNPSLESAKKFSVINFFDSIANRYDLMNNLMSFGCHHLWQQEIINKAGFLVGRTILDVCCGTGSITFKLAKKAGPSGKVIGIDLSRNMLAIAKKRSQKLGATQLQFQQADAASLPFPDGSFDCVTIAYGLRNVPNMKHVLLEIKRVLKPDGRLVSLELSKPCYPTLRKFYLFYLKKWIPLVGKLITHNQAAYQYLHDSIRCFPTAGQVSRIIQDLGYEKLLCDELSWGVAALHMAFKPK